MASPQAIVGVTVASISTSVATPESLPTLIAFIAVTSIIFGVILFAAGYFRLGGLVRYLPYPVIGGFLAGTGVLILLGAFTFVGESLQFHHLSMLLERESLIRWLPAFLFGLGLFVAIKKSKHFLVLPGFITAGVIISYALFAFLGLQGSTSQAGLLIGYLPEKLWEADILVKQIGMVDWGFILRNAPSIAAIVLISSIAMLLNETGVEVATRTRLDFNHDMRNAGIGNIIAGLGGGMAGVACQTARCAFKNLTWIEELNGVKIRYSITGMCFWERSIYANPLKAGSDLISMASWSGILRNVSFLLVAWFLNRGKLQMVCIL